MDSGGISRLSKKAFWPLPWELNYKKETPQAFRSMLSFFSQKKKSLPKNNILLNPLLYNQYLLYLHP
jgi:hypothetical protein